MDKDSDDLEEYKIEANIKDLDKPVQPFFSVA